MFCLYSVVPGTGMPRSFLNDMKRWRKPCKKRSVGSQRYAGSNCNHKVRLGGNNYIYSVPGCTSRPDILVEQVGGKKVPQIPPFIHPHSVWLGKDFPWRTTVYWWDSAEYIQGCTGRSLNHFRNDRENALKMLSFCWTVFLYKQQKKTHPSLVETVFCTKSNIL